MTPAELTEILARRDQSFLDAHATTQRMVADLFWWGRLAFVVFFVLLLLKLCMHLVVFFKQVMTNRETLVLLERVNKLIEVVEQHGGVTDRQKERTVKAAEAVIEGAEATKQAASLLSERVAAVEQLVGGASGTGLGPVEPHGPPFRPR